MLTFRLGVTGCPTKHDSWWIVENIFFHNLLSWLIPKTIIKILWELYCSKLDFKVKYIWAKDFFNEINCKKNFIIIIQYMYDYIKYYSLTVMFRGTPCTLRPVFLSIKSCHSDRILLCQKAIETGMYPKINL